MKLLNQTDRHLIDVLWNDYVAGIAHVKTLRHYLLESKKKIVLDHLAIIDLPSPYTGVDVLAHLFSSLGFRVQGRDYLPEKQNAFLWLVEQDAYLKSADDMLPQVVVADFCLSELSISIRTIIQKYTAQIQASPLPSIQRLAGQAYLGNQTSADKLLRLLLDYFTRAWALPSVSDFRAVHEANELLAWVLLFGRKPNHFAISVHLLGGFKDLAEFHSDLPSNIGCVLNEQGTLIKGNRQIGVAQSSTMADFIACQLSDGNIRVRDRFIEFIWRYVKHEGPTATQWCDFHTHFIAANANQVIESLYE